MRFPKFPRIPLKVIIVFLIAAILLISVYIIFFNVEDKDAIAPKIRGITGNTTANAGEVVDISVNFTDNVGVTNATIYYKTANANDWSSMSILNGSVDIFISLDPVEDLYYYVTIDDAAGNGPVGDPSINGSTYYVVTVVDNSDDENDDDQNSIHYVFVEEGTETDCKCKSCPAVADILHELYESGKYHFYYVSLVKDRSSKANTRLSDDYDVYGFPTVFIDGGYKVIVGGNNDKSEYEKAILDARSRDAPDIQVTVSAKYDNKTDKLTTEVIVENNEKETYSGRLKVYLTEIVSQWNGYDGKPYHYGFVDYVINEAVSMDANGEKNFSDTRSVSDYDYENLMIMAVVFNSESADTYEYQNEEENSFDAYYADAVDATNVAEGGNLPPEVGITSPVKGKMYFLDSPILEKLGSFKNTFLIGKTTISVYASDDSGIEKVEFYVDGDLMKTVESEPYNWTLSRISTYNWTLSRISTFKELFYHKHTIEVKAYDDTGKTSSASIEVWARL
jgi:glutaredoxin